MAKGRISSWAGIGCLLVMAIALAALEGNAPRIPTLLPREDPNGIWAISIDPNPSAFFSWAWFAGQYSDGSFLAVSPWGIDDTFQRIFRINRQGNLIRQTLVLSPDRSFDISDLCTLPDGGYAAVGRYCEFTHGDEYWRMWAARFRSDGSIVWSRFWNRNPPFENPSSLDSIAALPEGGFVAAGNYYERTHWIVRLNDDGAVLGQTRISLNNNEGDIKIRPDGRGGFWGLVGGYDCLLLKITSDMTVSFCSRFNIRGNILYLHTFQVDEDGGVVVSGYYSETSPAWRRAHLVLSFDRQASIKQAVEFEEQDFYGVHLFSDGGLLLTTSDGIVRLNPGWENGWARTMVSLINPSPSSAWYSYQTLWQAVPTWEGDGLLLLGSLAGQHLFARTDIEGGSCGLLDAQVEVVTQKVAVNVVPIAAQTRSISWPETTGSLATQAPSASLQGICPTSTTQTLRFEVKGYSPRGPSFCYPTSPSPGVYSVPEGFVLKCIAYTSEDYELTRWEGDVPKGTPEAARVVSFLMDKPRTIRAVYGPSSSYLIHGLEGRRYLTSRSCLNSIEFYGQLNHADFSYRVYFENDGGSGWQYIGNAFLKDAKYREYMFIHILHHTNVRNRTYRYGVSVVDRAGNEGKKVVLVITYPDVK